MARLFAGHGTAGHGGRDPGKFRPGKRWRVAPSGTWGTQRVRLVHTMPDLACISRLATCWYVVDHVVGLELRGGRSSAFGPTQEAELTKGMLPHHPLACQRVLIAVRISTVAPARAFRFTCAFASSPSGGFARPPALPCRSSLPDWANARVRAHDERSKGRGKAT